MEWKKNQEAQVEITGVTAQGAGVGRLEGLAVFVPLTAPGDVARIKLLKVAKNYAWGKVTELLTPSPLRQEPDCPQFAQCGGCCYRASPSCPWLPFWGRRAAAATGTRPCSPWAGGQTAGSPWVFTR